MKFMGRQFTDVSKWAKFVLICLPGIFGIQQTSIASNTHSLTSLLGAIEVHLATQYPSHTYKTHVGKIDSRLRLTQCADVSIFKPLHAPELGQTSIGVKCNSTTNWQIFVPVTIQKFTRVAVAISDYPRGHVMTSKDIKLVEKDVSNLRQGYFEQKSNISGMITRRTIHRGSVLTPGMVKHPRYVKRGDEIIIMAESKNLVIRAKGKAMMDGRKGDRIRVKNTQSKREFQATVIAPGLVRVSM